MHIERGHRTRIQTFPKVKRKLFKRRSPNATFSGEPKIFYTNTGVTFHLIGLLGEGNTGKVYRTLQPRLLWWSARRALKLMRADWEIDHVTRLLEMEAMVTNRIRSPFVTTAMDVGWGYADHHRHGFVLYPELMGSSLKNLLNLLNVGRAQSPNNPWIIKWLKIWSIQRIMDQLFKGVQAFHDVHLIHNDIDPSNLIINDKQRVQIIDHSSCTLMDNPFLFLHSKDFSAPEVEQRQLDQIGPWSDIYSIGKILQFIHRIFPTTPEGEEVANQFTQKNIEKRPQNIQEARALFEAQYPKSQ